MTVTFKKLVNVGTNDTPVSRAVRPINQRADRADIEQGGSIDRKLRNRIFVATLVASGLAWIAIILFFRFVIF